MKEFQQKLSCHSTELVHFRKRIGAKGVERIFRMSIGLHEESALEDVVHVETTVHEKNIMYPTDTSWRSGSSIASTRLPNSTLFHSGILLSKR